MAQVITSYCKIKDQQVLLNGELVLAAPSGNADIHHFLRYTYEQLGCEYPRFFKMDALSKLCFCAAETMIPQSGIVNRTDAGDIALLFSNRQSSILSDKAHQETINDPWNFFPNPAVFVYTLPNIMVGEMCIRHQLTGDTTFLLSEEFDADMHHRYLDCLMQQGAAQAVISGWVEADENGYEAFLYMVEDSMVSAGLLPHTPGSLTALYHNSKILTYGNVD
ncbi:MAG TPA: hypothetical protein VJ720_04330 [Chitinophaga sp.]|nr:hypothetical protein [Chitinophaga sp.]